MLPYPAAFVSFIARRDTVQFRPTWAIIGASKSTHQEAFDVLMLRNGATETTATAQDYRRVTVRAADPMRTIEGYHATSVVKHRPKLRARSRRN